MKGQVHFSSLNLHEVVTAADITCLELDLEPRHGATIQTVSFRLGQ